MWLLEFGGRSSWTSLDMTFGHSVRKSLFCFKYSFWGNAIKESWRVNRIIAPENIKSKTEPNICKWTPTLTGVDSAVALLFQGDWLTSSSSSLEILSRRLVVALQNKQKTEHVREWWQWWQLRSGLSLMQHEVKLPLLRNSSTAPVPVFVLDLIFDLLLIIELHLQEAQFLLQRCRLWRQNKNRSYVSWWLKWSSKVQKLSLLYVTVLPS